MATEQEIPNANYVSAAATRIVGQVKDQVAVHAEHQREHLASSIHAVAETLRGAGEDFQKQNGGFVSGYALRAGNVAAEQVEQLASYFSEREVKEIIEDTERFARRSPALFLGGAFLLGFAASRFLKSTPPRADLFANMPDPSHALPAGSGDMRAQMAASAGYSTHKRGDTGTTAANVQVSTADLDL